MKLNPFTIYSNYYNNMQSPGAKYFDPLTDREHNNFGSHKTTRLELNNHC